MSIQPKTSEILRKKLTEGYRAPPGAARESRAPAPRRPRLAGAPHRLRAPLLGLRGGACGAQGRRERGEPRRPAVADWSFSNSKLERIFEFLHFRQKRLSNSQL